MLGIGVVGVERQLRLVPLHGLQQIALRLGPCRPQLQHIEPLPERAMGCAGLQGFERRAGLGLLPGIDHPLHTPHGRLPRARRERLHAGDDPALQFRLPHGAACRQQRRQGIVRPAFACRAALGRRQGHDLPVQRHAVPYHQGVGHHTHTLRPGWQLLRPAPQRGKDLIAPRPARAPVRHQRVMRLRAVGRRPVRIGRCGLPLRRPGCTTLLRLCPGGGTGQQRSHGYPFP